MKHLILATVLVIIVLVGSFFMYKYIENVSDEFSKTIEEVESSINKNSWKDAKLLFDKFHKQWEPNAKLWMLVIGHEEIDHIEKSLIESTIYIREENKEALVELELLKYYLQHINQKEQIRLNNIF